MNYWDNHGILFLIFMFFFPRFTLFVSVLFTSMVSGGLLWWLGFIFTPRLLVAILATMSYGSTNIILVICAWFWALGGEPFEKTSVTKVYRKRKLR